MERRRRDNDDWEAVRSWVDDATIRDQPVVRDVDSRANGAAVTDGDVVADRDPISDCCILDNRVRPDADVVTDLAAIDHRFRADPDIVSD